MNTLICYLNTQTEERAWGKYNRATAPCLDLFRFFNPSTNSSKLLRNESSASAQLVLNRFLEKVNGYAWLEWHLKTILVLLHICFLLKEEHVHLKFLTSFSPVCKIVQKYDILITYFYAYLTHISFANCSHHKMLYFRKKTTDLLNLPLNCVSSSLLVIKENQLILY